MDANTALAAIRRLDGRELNGRKLRVSYSNNSNLRDLARQIGQEVSENPNQKEYQAVTNLQLHEAWDILDIMRKMAVDDKGMSNI
jgi:RNA recognition motif-containing protein